MKKTILLSLIMTLFLAACGSSEKKKDAEKKKSAKASKEESKTSPERVRKITADWPEERQTMSKVLSSKYGQPDEVTSNMLIWHNNSPWKKTILYRGPDNGMLEQFVSFSVPPEKMGDISLFSDAVIVNSNSGMVSARSDREELNFLSMNLTKEIVDGNMGAIEARRQYSLLTDTLRKSQYMDSLNFERAPGSSPEAKEAQEAMEAEEAQ